MNFAALCSGECLVNVPLDQVTVIPGVLYKGGTIAMSGCLEQSLRSFLDELPGDMQGPEEEEVPWPKKRKMKGDTYEHLLGAFPWFVALEAKEGFSAKSSEASA
eukprot:9379563-Lingulodinium_polyedra.AAC.1